jgi:hypothetical protein
VLPLQCTNRPIKLFQHSSHHFKALGKYGGLYCQLKNNSSGHANFAKFAASNISVERPSLLVGTVVVSTIPRMRLYFRRPFGNYWK